jgi:hypothetical protein
MEVRVVRVRLILAVLILSAYVSACGDKSPTAPTPPPTPTRSIVLEANLNFGTVEIGSSVTRELRIINTGTDTLAITGMNSPGAGAGGVFVASWTSGSIAPGAFQISTLRFTPTAAQTYGGTLTVNGNQTSGTNTIPISGTGAFPPRPTFSRTGTGDTVFDMPIDVARVRIIGIYSGNSSNFVVRIGGRLIVNELLGTGWSMTRYDGTLLTGGGGTVAITLSSGVQWSFEEIR